MSFTADIKRELSALPLISRERRSAALAGLLDTCGYAEGESLRFVSENETVAAFLLALTEELCGVRMQVGASFDPKRERDKVTFLCAGEDAMTLLSCAAREPEGEEESAAYLRGAFLGSGSCTIPRGDGKAGYHLEMVLRSADGAEKLCDILDGVQIIGSTVRRGERFVVYLKSREAIADFLSVTGAEAALRRMENVAAVREESNNFNRVSNCYAGNADKSAIASAMQIVAFNELQERGVLLALPEPLRETARARMERPTLSIAELAESLGLTKSCLNHRLRKLMQIYGERNS